ncbi:DUF6920 family protein [Aquibacillus sediminis]|uniref:DUF6920 family protein n=1 Tax=Aquibacillus sediminis TaxID=2574734 RepID=UPI001109D65A|nr:DUF6544 family protein [Aquibacillus sediminis]
MKYAFILLVSVHGLIHLLGFVKAFKLVEVNQLKVEISKSIGLIWLVTTFLFIAIGLLLLLNNNLWWLPAIITVAFSQTVIFFSWQDAKFGTVVNVIILVVAFVAMGAWQLRTEANQDIEQLLTEAQTEQSVVPTKSRLASVPPIIRQWLQQNKVIETEPIVTVSFKQKGQMKLKPDQKKWYKAEAEQYVSVKRPGFVWNASVEMMPLIHVAGKDVFHDGDGRMQMELLSILPVVHIANNNKVDQSTMQRFLLELPWYPSAALEPYITWESLNPTTAQATMSYKGKTGSAIYYFDEDGNLDKVSAMRYKDHDDNAEPLECIGEVKEMKMVDGKMIPTKMDVSWLVKGEKFTWYQLEIYDVVYTRGTRRLQVVS